MLIAQHNAYSRLVQSAPNELSWLADYLTFEDEKKRFMKFGGRPTRMLNDVTGDFPSGFVPMVVKAGGEEGFTVQVVDKRHRPMEAPTIDLEKLGEGLGGWLRDYQLETLKVALEKERGILWLPTGAGKTEIAVALSEALPIQWAFLVSSADLLHQTAERHEKRLGEPAGVIGDASWEPQRFNVCTFQTLAKRAEDPRCELLFDRTLGLIVDESHQLPADSFWRLAMRFKAAYWRFGMSGTPLARGDRRSILSIGALGPVIHRIKPEVLIERGVLARPTIHMIPCKQESEKATFAGVYTELVVKSKKRNALAVEATKRAKKPCLVFVKSVDHGKTLTKLIEAQGISTEFVWGQKDTKSREGSIRRLEHGDTEVIVASVVFNVGIDIPELRSLVNVAGGRSAIAAIQRVGRGMRVVEGKTEFDVYDFADSGHRWLTGQSGARKRSYLREGYSVVEAAELVTSTPKLPGL